MKIKKSVIIKNKGCFSSEEIEGLSFMVVHSDVVPAGDVLTSELTIWEKLYLLFECKALTTGEVKSICDQLGVDNDVYLLIMKASGQLNSSEPMDGSIVRRFRKENLEEKIITALINLIA